MSYRLERDESVEEGVRRIADEQISKAIAEVEDSDLGPHETVHQVRKRCKKIRALLRLTRPAFESIYDRENALFRDAARELSELRDATSRIECVDRLLEWVGSEDGGSGLDGVRSTLEEQRDEIFDGAGASDRLSRFRDGMNAARARAASWTLEASGFDAIEGGVRKTYRRARKAMDEAHESGSVESFHEWRKRVKYHRYHARLLRNLWEAVLESRRAALNRLSDLLGDAHDLAVTRRFLVEERASLDSDGSLQLVLGLADSRRKELEAWALPLGRRLFADKPKAWSQRARAYWESWHVEGELESALGALH